jgi:hypothetical protein
MNKRIKILISTLLLTINLTAMSVVANGEELNSTKMVQEALQQKTFYHYNMAYAEVMKMEDIAERDRLLGELGSITNIVWTDEIKYINTLIEDMCKTASGRTYDQIEATVNKSSLGAMDKGYLLGELTSWGRKLVWTADYVAGVEKLGSAWTKLEASDADTVFANAETEINKIKNTPSREYLLEELQKAKVEKNKRSDVAKRIGEINSADKPVQQKITEIGSILSTTDKIKIPERYKEEDKFNAILKIITSSYGQKNSTIEWYQELINGFVADSERGNLKGITYKGGLIDLKANNGTEEIDVTDQVLATEPAFVEGIKVKLYWAGTATGPQLYDYKQSEYLTVRNNRVYLKPKVPTSGAVTEGIRVGVYYIDETGNGSVSSIKVRINP